MYRPPFVNLVPDFLMADAAVLRLGLAGCVMTLLCVPCNTHTRHYSAPYPSQLCSIRAAGFWHQWPAVADDDAWQLRAAPGAYAAC